MLKGAPTKRLWANKYNGLGGHIEKGEDILSAAKRELFEETGLSAELWHCGTLMVDTDQTTGICLYVFSGNSDSGEPVPSDEGFAEWVPFFKIEEIPTVEDVPILLDRIRKMKRGDPPFSARSHYDEYQRLIVEFG